MAQDFITIKIWRITRKKAKELALDRDISLAELIDRLISQAFNLDRFIKEADAYEYPSEFYELEDEARQSRPERG